MLSFSGILVFIGLCGTFLHANSTIKRQVSLKVHTITCTAVTLYRTLPTIIFTYMIGNENAPDAGANAPTYPVSFPSW